MDSRCDDLVGVFVALGSQAEPARRRLVDQPANSARLRDGTATSASVGSAGIVGWNAGSYTGVSLYGTNGTRRFRALAGRWISGVVVGDRYMYARAGLDVWACRGTTFVLDAQTGAIAARVATPIVTLVRGTERDGH